MNEKNQNYKLEISLLAISLTVVLISFFLSMYDNENLWFVRSGSIMVLLAVIVEYKLNQRTLKNINRKSNMSTFSGLPINLLNSQKHTQVSLIAHSFIILGTLIWGYGDFVNK